MTKAKPPRYRYRLGWRSLKTVVPSLSKAKAVALSVELAEAMVRFEITTAKRATMFIAQIAHESDAFRAREEYASGHEYDIAVNRQLALDLGNVNHGDGVRFKGRSYIQITGRANYKAISEAFGVNFLAHPEKLAEPKYAALGAAWWWSRHGCNGLADSGDFIALTRRINGGVNGLAFRQAYYRRARLVSRFLTPKRRKPA